MKRDVEDSDPDMMESSPRKRSSRRHRGVLSPKSVLSDFHGLDGKSISVINGPNDDESHPRRSRFNNIFKKKADDKSSSPAKNDRSATPTKEQIMKKPHLLFSKKRDPRG